MTVNIINQATSENYEPLLRKVLKKTYKMTKTSTKKPINVVIVSNEKIKELNATYRNKDALTDVLTFPSDVEEELGDVFIAYKVALEQANDYGHSFKRELAFLTVHGFLHAIGYDHHTEEEAEKMFQLQETILDALKIYR